jgi:hypothetical protein
MSTLKREWAEEAEHLKLTDILGEAFDEIIGCMPIRAIMGEMLAVERTFRFLMAEGYDAEDIKYVLDETDMYFSDRHIGAKNEFREEPEPFKCPPDGVSTARGVHEHLKMF